jgi:hypothetical protein
LLVKGGLSSGGVGSCKIGRGGALLERGSVTPGIVGMSGGRLRAVACMPASNAGKRTFESIMNGKTSVVNIRVVDRS